MLLLLAKSAVCTQKIGIYPPHTLVFLEEYVCKRVLSIRIHTFFGRATADKIVVVASAGTHENVSKKNFRNLAFFKKLWGFSCRKMLGVCSVCFRRHMHMLSIRLRIVHVHLAYAYNLYANDQHMLTICKRMLSICV